MHGPRTLAGALASRSFRLRGCHLPRQNPGFVGHQDAKALAGPKDMEVHRHAPCSRDKGTWKGQGLDPAPHPSLAGPEGSPGHTVSETGDDEKRNSDGKGPRKERDLGPALAGRAACLSLRPGVPGPRAMAEDLLHLLLSAVTCIAGQWVSCQRGQWHSAGKEPLSWVTFLLRL